MRPRLVDRSTPTRPCDLNHARDTAGILQRGFRHVTNQDDVPAAGPVGPHYHLHIYIGCPGRARNKVDAPGSSLGMHVGVDALPRLFHVADHILEVDQNDVVLRQKIVARRIRLTCPGHNASRLCHTQPGVTDTAEVSVLGGAEAWKYTAVPPGHGGQAWIVAGDQLSRPVALVEVLGDAFGRLRLGRNTIYTALVFQDVSEKGLGEARMGQTRRGRLGKPGQFPLDFPGGKPTACSPDSRNNVGTGALSHYVLFAVRDTVA